MYWWSRRKIDERKAREFRWSESSFELFGVLSAPESRDQADFFLGEAHTGTLDLRAGRADFGNGLRKWERQRETHETRSGARLTAHANSSGRNGE